ncbi:MAG: carbohydrate kinase [Candidatus Omnitrophica bacterium]|nr:carbohydrate kinase [Candidatus Omnitrophota bacterium]MBU4589457.1 carbohydrate kinase [Candidatus Omnitrophota bacterium]
MPVDVLFLGGTSIDLIQDKNKKIRNRSVGGGITNSAIIAAKLGLKTAMLSRIGKDTLGDFAVKFLRSCGVNTKGIIQDPSIRTPIAIANIDKHGNSKYTFYKNPPKDSIVPLKGVPKDLLRSCKIFHFGSSFSYQKETSAEALKYVKFLKKRGVFISLDPNLRPYAIKDKRAAKNRVLGLLKWVDLARLSETDLKFLTGHKNNTKSLKSFKKWFRCEVILTLGAKGSIYPYMSLRGAKRRSNLNLIKVPAVKVKVADTIGAGDAFNAALLYKIAKIGERRVFSNIKPQLAFASRISALICTKPGAHKALPKMAV